MKSLISRLICVGICAVLASACSSDATRPAPARATSVGAVSAQIQAVHRGTAVPETPSVRVADQNGQPMGGVPVSFEVVSGGGTLGGTEATTDSSGVARAPGVWTVGLTPGVNTVTATAPGLTPVVFMATAQDPCLAPTAHAVFTTSLGELTELDCGVWPRRDLWSVTLPSTQAVTLSVQTTSFEPQLLLRDPNGASLFYPFPPEPTVRLVAPPGTPLGFVVAALDGRQGPYTLSSASTADPDACGVFWIIPGVQFEGEIRETGCNIGDLFVDQYHLHLGAGDTLTVRMNSSDLDAALYLDGGGQFLTANNNGGGGTNALLTYTSTRSAVYILTARSAGVRQTGRYSLQVTRSSGTAAASQSP